MNVTVHAATSNFKVESQGGQGARARHGRPRDGTRQGNGHACSPAPWASRARYKTVATERLASNQGNFAILAPLAPGNWNVKVKFSDPRAGRGRDLADRQDHDRPEADLGHHGELVQEEEQRVHARRHGDAVRRVGREGRTAEDQHRIGAPAKFAVFGTANLGVGKNKVTFKAKLKRAARWVLQLEYVRPGEAPSFSGLKTITIR